MSPVTDVALSMMADEVAALSGRARSAEADRDAFREVAQVATGMLARVTYERDRALAALYARTRQPRTT